MKKFGEDYLNEFNMVNIKSVFSKILSETNDICIMMKFGVMKLFFIQ
jgi:hypothetical protein